ncbi:hypothetical protein EBB54_03715 [Schaedlerella arabinosiphila]|uniref:Uncharacterized protein n=1 Tax=Schaedlerella arabinosiphila TaxID=2044587 RepID=A0A3R8KVE6_9FIRM|nr:hypothetical protein [Schaedlerella arabinosiphila]RRK30585.1 hypothetical protein EBB54_03715 [Schaedlerella arabinosiphila]
MKNWWYYHKWYVLCGVILFLIGIDIIGNNLGWFRDTPDLQIAYIGDHSLPEDIAASIENTFTSLAGDYNHDGKILVKINQFVSNISAGDAESLSYQQAAEIALIGDIDDCTSYFFLMEDPGKVQRDFQVLAMPDGSCPDEYDFSAEGKVIPWDFGLYLGRRCFYSRSKTLYAEECSQIWDTLQTDQTLTGG